MKACDDNEFSFGGQEFEVEDSESAAVLAQERISNLAMGALVTMTAKSLVLQPSSYVGVKKCFLYLIRHEDKQRQRELIQQLATVIQMLRAAPSLLQ